MEYVAIVFWIIGSLLPKQDMDTSLENLNKYYEAVAHIESGMRHDAKNPVTTAKSYFQITDGSFLTAKARAARMGYDIQVKYVMTLGYEEQRNLLFLDLYQRRGTDQYIRGILQGSKWFALQTYFKFHHTNPCPATIARAKRIFGEYYD